VASDGALRITLTRDDDAIIVGLEGDLDVNVAPLARSHLSDAIDRAVAHEIHRVVLDASAVAFCDSTGLSILLGASEEASQRGVALTLREVSEPVRELLALTGVDQLLDTDR
jgi:anti-anti-sigma factor